MLYHDKYGTEYEYEYRITDLGECLEIESIGWCDLTGNWHNININADTMTKFREEIEEYFWENYELYYYDD